MIVKRVNGLIVTFPDEKTMKKILEDLKDAEVKDVDLDER
ncbi:hypothetical protein Stok01_02930 [Sulfurisphaera tokodaii]